MLSTRKKKSEVTLIAFHLKPWSLFFSKISLFCRATKRPRGIERRRVEINSLCRMLIRLVASCQVEGVFFFSTRLAWPTSFALSKLPPRLLNETTIIVYSPLRSTFLMPTQSLGLQKRLPNVKSNLSASDFDIIMLTVKVRLLTYAACNVSFYGRLG